MAQTLKLNNFDQLNLLELTVLNADAAAGATALTVVNNTNYAAADYIIVGTIGGENSELRTVASVTGTTGVTTDALVLNHNRYDQVNKLFGNQLKIYRAPNVDGNLPADSAFATIATIAIEVDQLSTVYTDGAGSSAYWYKFTYFNSTSTAETALADSNAQRGGGYGHYVSISDIRTEAGLQDNQNISEAIIDSMRIEAEQEVDGELYGVYTLPFALPTPAKVQQAVRQIAAGELLKREYGPMSNGSKAKGEDLASRGRLVLQGIKYRETVLLDPNHNSLLLQPTVTSWPNATTDQSGSGVSDSELAANNQDRGANVRSSMRF